MGITERRLSSLESKVAKLEARTRMSKEERKKFGSDNEEKKSLDDLEQAAQFLIQNFKPNIFNNKEKAEMVNTVEEMISDIKKTDSKTFKDTYLGKLNQILDAVKE